MRPRPRPPPDPPAPDGLRDLPRAAPLPRAAAPGTTRDVERAGRATTGSPRRPSSPAGSTRTATPTGGRSRSSASDRWMMLDPGGEGADPLLRRTGRAGIPTTVVFGGTSSSTTASAPTRALAPISMSPRTLAPVPIRAPRPILGPRSAVPIGPPSPTGGVSRTADSTLPSITTCPLGSTRRVDDRRVGDRDVAEPIARR